MYGIKHEYKGSDGCDQARAWPEYECYDSISDVNRVFCIQTAATVLDYNFGIHCTAAVLDSAGRLSTAASEAL